MNYQFIEFKVPKPSRGRAFRKAMPLTDFDRYLLRQLKKAGAKTSQVVRFSHMHLSPDIIKREWSAPPLPMHPFIKDTLLSDNKE